MIFTDQLKREIELKKIPQRIVSLVPSQTELLYELGLDERVVGITKFCIHPDDWFRSKKRVGGTKTVDIRQVRELKPDLIIGNKEENELADILELEKIAPVWMSDISDLTDSLEMIGSIGEICGKKSEAQQLIREIKDAFQKAAFVQGKKTVLYLIWAKPWMAAAQHTFIDSMLREIGFKNYFSAENRYPEWIPDKKNQPDYIFLSSEPYPFKEEHLTEIQLLSPNSKVIFVDGEMFSWYGSRLKLAVTYFKELKESLK